ncbi:MAG: DeoR/GlpR family DNA-binding transcription regulator [Bacillota bacterium]|nr:DeoR/GlpR family DNA-binding transcription regulator [Bacillota bacterium]
MADVSNMFVSERFNLMLEYLKKNGRATVDELAEKMYVSKATVRRDLSQMQKMGLIQRTHGGAIPFDNSDEVNIFVRMEKNQGDKVETATLALNKIPEFTSVFIDNSSTCLALAERMNFDYKTVVTNGLQLALKLSPRENVKVILLGGVVQFKTFSTSGVQANLDLEMFRFDIMLCGATGIDKDGAYESNSDTMIIKKQAFAQSAKRYLLVDKSKFGQSYMYRNQKVEEYDAIITNAPDELCQDLRTRGANVVNR